MASNNLWSGYLAARTSFMTTELNALAAATLVVSSVGGVSGVFDNSVNLYELADLEFLAGGTYTPSAGNINVWFLRTLDGGTSFEDGAAGVTPGRLPDAVINVRAGTTITPRSGCPGVLLPPDKFKVLALNSTGATLPATGNIISYRPYTTQQ